MIRDNVDCVDIAGKRPLCVRCCCSTETEAGRGCRGHHCSRRGVDLLERPEVGIVSRRPCVALLAPASGWPACRSPRLMAWRSRVEVMKYGPLSCEPRDEAGLQLPTCPTAPRCLPSARRSRHARVANSLRCSSKTCLDRLSSARPRSVSRAAMRLDAAGQGSAIRIAAGPGGSCWESSCHRSPLYPILRHAVVSVSRVTTSFFTTNSPGRKPSGQIVVPS